jgi:murein hydrolase activator
LLRVLCRNTLFLVLALIGANPAHAADNAELDALRGCIVPTRGELISHFGTPRSDSGLSWKGLYIRSASGQEVRAVAAGRVVFAEWMRGFGNLMIIDHGQSYLTIYGNGAAQTGG